MSDRPESAISAMNRKWQELNVKAKSSFTFTLVYEPLSHLIKIVDVDKRTGKDPWEALDNIYRTSNTQKAINIARELAMLQLE